MNKNTMLILGLVVVAGVGGYYIYSKYKVTKTAQAAADNQNNGTITPGGGSSNSGTAGTIKQVGDGLSQLAGAFGL